MRRSRPGLPYLLILPSLVLAFWIIGYPIYDVRRHLAARRQPLRPGQGLRRARQLHAACSPTRCSCACLWRTLVWTLAVVGGTVLLSVPIAMILNDDFYGRGIARIIIMLPWAVSLTMSAIVWRWALNGQFGMLNATLFELGLLHTPVEWLATAETAFPAEIAVGILVSIPFTTTVLLGGLSSLPERHLRGGAHRRGDRTGSASGT